MMRNGYNKTTTKENEMIKQGNTNTSRKWDKKPCDCCGKDTFTTKIAGGIMRVCDACLAEMEKDINA